MSPVACSAEAGIAVLTIDNPPANTLSEATLAALSSALDAIEGETSVRAVIITGAGATTFVGGADVNEFLRVRSGDDARAKAERGAALSRRLELFPKPTIAAVNGVCAGGDCELALACDVRIMAASASIGQPEIRLGIIPGWGGTQRLPRLVGRSHALWLMMSGEMIEASRAFETGLANEVVADAMLFTSSDAREGIASFLAKRRPSFQGT